ncbi:hypothetical protein Rfer_4321 (plasmid) [Rhodoferax ferrireducens T118]|uniref:Uncharacterized protein n=1 Tax=Albidiferax ferrireducens (strain ATCC BAA-621 / DSM 15236 / T118) TaxID=338969 RepID=Q21QD8_ALBFT|nr:hypothetical protein [Rhodoferax ferrireducens]ABD72007.1 hypothetical protein Rfer_4321 [Rhodoferax ferrireducens T118]
MSSTDHTLSGGQKFWICDFTGEVVEANKVSHTSIHQGSPSYMTNVSGDGSVGLMVVPGAVSSTEHTSQELWLKNVDGEEQSFGVGHIGLPMRVGHVVTVVWIGGGGKTEGRNVAARNHTTGEIRCELERVLSDNFNTLMFSDGAGKGSLTWAAVGAVLGMIFVSVFLREGYLLPGAFFGAFVGLSAYPILGRFKALRGRLFAELSGVVKNRLEAIQAPVCSEPALTGLSK